MSHLEKSRQIEIELKKKKKMCEIRCKILKNMLQSSKNQKFGNFSIIKITKKSSIRNLENSKNPTFNNSKFRNI